MSGSALDRAFEVPVDVVFRELDGEAVILNLASGIYFGLDAVATSIWNAVQAGRTLDEIVAVLVEQYEVDVQTLASDVVRFANLLASKGLLAPAP